MFLKKVHAEGFVWKTLLGIISHYFEICNIESSWDCVSRVFFVVELESLKTYYCLPLMVSLSS